MEDNAKVYPYNKLRIVKGTQCYTDRPDRAGPHVAQRTYHTIAGTDTDADMQYVYWRSGNHLCWAKKRDVDIVEDKQ